MNEEEFGVMLNKILVKMFLKNLDYRQIIEPVIAEVIDYIENECICANYTQKCRSELIKKLTGKIP